MKYDVYFHNDFDGVASAAILCDFFRKRGDRVGSLHSVSYGMSEEWTRDDFFRKNSFFSSKGNAVAIVDFSFHPAASVWFDHHDAPFKKKEWESAFSPAPLRVFAPSYLSCVGLVAEVARKEGYRPPRSIASLVKWGDILDGARYASARQTIEKKEPALLFSALMDRHKRKGGDPFPVFVRALLRCNLSVSRVLAMSAYARQIKSIRAETKASLAFYRAALRRHGKVAVVDESDLRTVTLRYAPYALIPGIPFGVRVYQEPGDGDLFHFSVGYNPWTKGKCPLHIGIYLKKNFGGGGHERVGGCEIHGRAAMEKAVEKIIKDLNA